MSKDRRIFIAGSLIAAGLLLAGCIPESLSTEQKPRLMSQESSSPVSKGAHSSKHEPFLTAPTKETVLSKLDKGHPRLIVTDTRLEEIRSIAAKDPMVAEWIERAREKTDTILDEKPSHFERPDGRRLLPVSRKVLDRVYHLAFFYRYDKDEKYLERAYRELEAAGNFPNWNPTHWLDVAEMIHAFGIGYDWLYHGLSETQRTTLREALWRHGLYYSHAGYTGVKLEGVDRTWPYKPHNWSFVCNGGSAIGAMAIMDEMPDECSLIFRHAFENIQRPIPKFDPDGAWAEGVGYWGYSLRYLTPWLQSMESAFGTDFGFTDELKGRGFSRCGDFPVYLTSPFGSIFAFADVNPIQNFKAPALFFLAQKYNNPLYQHFERSGTGQTIMDVINYKPLKSGAKLDEVSLDKHFRNAEIATMRSSWTDPAATFIGMKCGPNGVTHSHQDLGSFILYDKGVQWFVDLGKERESYKRHKNGCERMDFYRIRTEGHNAVVINPAEKDSQDLKGSSVITTLRSSPSEALLVADLAKAYPDHVSKYQRGIRFFDHRRKILIRDEIEALGDAEMWWFGHTPAQIEVLDGGRKARLTYEDKVLYAHLQSPAEATFASMPAAPLPSSPNPDVQNRNKGISKLAVHIEKMQKGVIEIVMVPGYGFEEEPTVAVASKPIAEWNLAEKRPLLPGITLDGKPLPGFMPKVFTYTVTIPSDTQDFHVPAITVKGEGTVQVTPPTGVPGVATVTLSAESLTTEYRIYFVQENKQTEG